MDAGIEGSLISKTVSEFVNRESPLERLNAVSRIIKIREQDFEARVLKSEVPVLVHIGAPWCPPCRDLTPVLESIAQEYAGRLAVIEVDSDQYPDLASRYGAGRIPNLLFLWGGRVVRQEVGALPHSSLSRLIDELLQLASRDAAVR